MIEFARHTLDNGLTILTHNDPGTSLIAMNLLYRVGARDENSEMTGMAHLLEHLMFSGTPGIPDFDIPLQRAGGENNAFTNNDLTNYYLTLPAQNIETGCWLESDRMHNLMISEEKLAIQKKVVGEEFKERYLNQPYGDAWLILRSMTYRIHPYRWPTIGTSLSHIQSMNLHEVNQFYHQHYGPNNALLSFAGKITPDEGYRLADKWFSAIGPVHFAQPEYPEEPPQTEYRYLEHKAPVPQIAIYMAWHMGSRKSSSFYQADAISDLLGTGKSARLYRHLVREKKLLTEVDAFLTGDTDPGLFVIHGMLREGVKPEKVISSIQEELHMLQSDPVKKQELDKVKNRFESTHVFGQVNILDRAMNLGYYEWLGQPDLINSEPELYRAVTPSSIRDTARRLFPTQNCSCLVYIPTQTK
ncbi:MAG: insulinase family protein [Bacteroidales bacterium]|nr:insulinase family protein [Bacteroidales bacterium]